MLWAAHDQAEIYPSQEDLDGNRGNYPEIVGVAEELRSRATVPHLVQGHLPFIVRDLLPPDTRIVTVLRDPIARSISVLRFTKRRKKEYMHMTLDEVLDVAPMRDAMITNYQTKVFSIRHIDELESVNHPLLLKPWRLDLALENLADCDMVAFTERFSRIPDRLDELEIPHGDTLRTNTAQPADPDGSEELIERIAGFVDLDLKLYQAIRSGTAG